MTTPANKLVSTYQALPTWGRSFLTSLGKVVALIMLIYLPVAFVWHTGCFLQPRHDNEREAERARRAQIEKRADRAHGEWQEQCEQLERHLTPAERAVIVDEKDRQDSLERAGRAGQRLGEALRDR